MIDQLRQFGETRRGWLGVKIQSRHRRHRRDLGVKENTGALVAGVTPDSPAAKAGIQDGDVIVKFDGKDVTTDARPAAPRRADADRQGRRRRGAAQGPEEDASKVAVGRLTEEDEQPPRTPGSKDAPKGKGKGKSKDDKPGKDGTAKPSGRNSLIGLVLAPLTDDLRTKHSLDGKVKGVVVTEVDPASPAAEKGVKVGDVIVEVAQEPVTSMDEDPAEEGPEARGAARADERVGVALLDGADGAVGGHAGERDDDEDGGAGPGEGAERVDGAAGRGVAERDEAQDEGDEEGEVRDHGREDATGRSRAGSESGGRLARIRGSLGGRRRCCVPVRGSGPPRARRRRSALVRPIGRRVGRRDACGSRSDAPPAAPARSRGAGSARGRLQEPEARASRSRGRRGGS